MPKRKSLKQLRREIKRLKIQTKILNGLRKSRRGVRIPLRRVRRKPPTRFQRPTINIPFAQLQAIIGVNESVRDFEQTAIPEILEFENAVKKIKATRI